MQRKRAHFLQHVPFEGLGSIEAWLLAHDYEVGCTRLFAGDPLPEPSEIQLLIIMGGPMSVNDECEYPWLVGEKEFIRASIAAGNAILGICLGAQLISVSLGGEVTSSREPEIGWFPIRPVTEEARLLFEPCEVFHWHGETFSLPDGAIRLASSDACKNQAFRWGDRVFGLQFHLETTPESAHALVQHCRGDLKAGRFIQSEADLLSVGPSRYQLINGVMSRLLDELNRIIRPGTG